MLGCHNGGGGGIFSNVKRLVLKCIGTQKRLFSKFRLPVWAVRNAVTFSQGILQPDNHIFIFSPVHELLESKLKLDVRAILVSWRFVWSRFGGFLAFWRQCSSLARFLIEPENCVFFPPKVTHTHIPYLHGGVTMV